MMERTFVCEKCDHKNVCDSHLNKYNNSGCRCWEGWIPLSAGIVPAPDKDYVLLMLNDDVIEKEDNITIGMYCSDRKWYMGHISLKLIEDNSWIKAWRHLPTHEFIL